MEENKIWNASWIWSEPSTSSLDSHELVCFRREFNVVDSVDVKFIINVTADSRYRLFFNGVSVSVGPCKGDQYSHYYETVDLSHYVTNGKNVLAIKVLHYSAAGPFRLGENGPVSVQRAVRGGFLFEGELMERDGRVQMICSDETWLCKNISGFKLAPSPIVFFLGGFEETDGRCMSHGWEMPDYNDEGWANAKVITKTRDPFGQLTPWQLKARPIPPLYEKLTLFSDVAKADNHEAIQAYNAIIRDETSEVLYIEPNRSSWFEIDAGELTTGYVTLKMRGGRDSRVSLQYAESYEKPQSNLHERIKGKRDDAVNGILIGEADHYMVAGIGNETGVEIYEPFEFRTFRYIRLEIQSGEAPLEIVSLSYREVGYPLDIQASFACSDPELEQLWTLSLNTLKRCMHETYEDCPYYEQLQYAMDTRLQTQFTYAISGDDRMARRALFDFHSSALPSGILQSRYPSAYPQVIPSFSLYWIHMLYEHYMYFGDADLIRRYIPTLTGVLDWFRRLQSPEGLIQRTPEEYWPFYDWCKEWDRGTPPAHNEGPLTLLSQMFSTALRVASELYSAIHWKDAAREAKDESDRINEVLRLHCWRDDLGLFADGPEAEEFSQHTQVWGIRCGAITGDEAVSLLERTIESPTVHMTELSMPASYELFRVLSDYKVYDKAHMVIDRWKEYLNLHLTTLPEVPDDNHPRSDCHAWSALPISEFLGEILGVRPGDPGYSTIIIEPKSLGLTWAKGKVVTKHGIAEVEWSLDKDHTFQVTGCTPKKIPVKLLLPNGECLEFEEGGEFKASLKLEN